LELVEKLARMARNFVIKKGDYEGVKLQFLKFSKNYSQLNVHEADKLRELFDPKIRNGWFKVTTSIFSHSFIDADDLQKDDLCGILFAFYSFDNLDFGYDSLRDLDSVINVFCENSTIVNKNWNVFKKLTSRKIAKDNMQNIIDNTLLRTNES